MTTLDRKTFDDIVKIHLDGEPNEIDPDLIDLALNDVINDALSNLVSNRCSPSDVQTIRLGCANSGPNPLLNLVPGAGKTIANAGNSLFPRIFKRITAPSPYGLTNKLFAPTREKFATCVCTALYSYYSPPLTKALPPPALPAPAPPVIIPFILPPIPAPPIIVHVTPPPPVAVPIAPILPTPTPPPAKNKPKNPKITRAQKTKGATCVSLADYVSNTDWNFLVHNPMLEELSIVVAPKPSSLFSAAEQNSSYKNMVIQTSINASSLMISDAATIVLPDYEQSRQDKLLPAFYYGAMSILKYFQIGISQRASLADFPLYSAIPKKIIKSENTSLNLIDASELHSTLRFKNYPMPSGAGMTECFVPIRNLKSNEPEGYGYRNQLQIVFVNNKGEAAKQLTVPNPILTLTKDDINSALLGGGGALQNQRVFLFFGNLKCEQDLLPYGQIRYHGKNAVQGRKVIKAVSFLSLGQIKPKTFRGQAESEKDEGIITGMFRAARAYIFDWSPSNPQFPSPNQIKIKL